MVNFFNYHNKLAVMAVFITSVFTIELQINNKIIDTLMAHWAMDGLDLTAVSYTHLDVYKRQNCLCLANLMCFLSPSFFELSTLYFSEN